LICPPKGWFLSCWLKIFPVTLASAVQIYLDLRGFRERGEEAAAKLLEEVIRPQWQVERGI